MNDMKAGERLDAILWSIGQRCFSDLSRANRSTRGIRQPQNLAVLIGLVLIHDISLWWLGDVGKLTSSVIKVCERVTCALFTHAILTSGYIGRPSALPIASIHGVFFKSSQISKMGRTIASQACLA